MGLSNRQKLHPAVTRQLAVAGVGKDGLALAVIVVVASRAMEMHEGHPPRSMRRSRERRWAALTISGLIDGVNQSRAVMRSKLVQMDAQAAR